MNEGTGQGIGVNMPSMEEEFNLIATDGDIWVTANTSSGGALTAKSILTALKGDITLVNTGNTFVVCNYLTATSKNISINCASTSLPLTSSQMILTAEESIELISNGGGLSFPADIYQPILAYGDSVFVNDGTGNLEIVIAESSIEYNGESQKPELEVLVDGIAISSDDYTVEYYDESDTPVEEMEALGIYKMVIKGANSSWTLNGVFEIIEKDITDAVITVKKDTFTYNGEEQSVEIESVVVDGITLSESDYQVSGDKATDVGNYELRITAVSGGNFTGTATLRYVIEEVDNNAGDNTGNNAGNNAGNNTGNNTEDKAPNAGDSANVGLMMIVCVVAMIGVAICQKKMTCQN